MRRGLGLFNRREFFECHEALEEIWTPARGPERLFLQALIHFAVGFYHHQRGNRPGAERQLRKGLKKIASYLPEFLGVRTAPLERNVRLCLETIETGGTIERFPRIALATRRRRIAPAVLALWAAAVSVAASTPKAPEQPIPFSHRQHAAVAACNLCHPKAATGERAGLPDAARCMLCHAGVKSESPGARRLAGYQREGKAIPWVRVYRVPDFVFFSHAPHLKAKLDCVACHGPVAQRDALAQEIPTDMKTCMKCHKTRTAPNACNVCHELGQ